MEPIRVLVVEDSPTQRRQIVSVIHSAPDMVVVGQARDGIEAVQLVEKLRPDVISMDLRMPHLDGLDATRQIMEQCPTPIMIVSTAVSDAELTIQAMQAGALAAIEKPPAANHPDFVARCDELLLALRLTAGVRMNRNQRPPEPRPPGTAATALRDRLRSGSDARPEVVAIGASAGGPSALARLLSALPADFSLPIVIVQHLAAEFIPGLAQWLNRSSALPVQLAREGDVLHSGAVFVAPGGYHMKIGADKRIMLDSFRGLHRHQPAVDILLNSIAEAFGPHAIGILLTGMGDDGAAGLHRMRQRGARTIAQDEETCVVFGMPAAAITLDAVEFVLPLDEIATVIAQLGGEGKTYGTGSLAR